MQVKTIIHEAMSTHMHPIAAVGPLFSRPYVLSEGRVGFECAAPVLVSHSFDFVKHSWFRSIIKIL